jgi:hypothetical protein
MELVLETTLGGHPKQTCSGPCTSTYHFTTPEGTVSTATGAPSPATAQSLESRNFQADRRTAQAHATALQLFHSKRPPEPAPHPLRRAHAREEATRGRAALPPCGRRWPCVALPRAWPQWRSRVVTAAQARYAPPILPTPLMRPRGRDPRAPPSSDPVRGGGSKDGVGQQHRGSCDEIPSQMICAPGRGNAPSASGTAWLHGGPRVGDGRNGRAGGIDVLTGDHSPRSRC